MAAQKEEEGEIRRAGEYKKLFGLLLELMRKIITIFGKECMSADELSDITDAGLESLELGIPPLSMDQVVLGDLKRTRLPQVRALFIVGLNDGIIPPVPEDRGIFNDEDKNVLAGLGLEMSANRYEQELEDEFYTYLAFTRPTDSLWFSLSDSGGDGEARPDKALFDVDGLPGVHVPGAGAAPDRMPGPPAVEGDLLWPCQGQGPVVFQQHHALGGQPAYQLPVLLLHPAHRRVSRGKYLHHGLPPLCWFSVVSVYTKSGCAASAAHPKTEPYCAGRGPFPAAILALSVMPLLRQFPKK